ncbi:protein shisa-5-like isoform X2 [Hippoglossus hippoglossus]|uniref:protein shisa-5-like isoform X2 n=1 Tax=Hippoglossus hippoglossus TaxID=8267 RepID=UPI00148D16DE|nr:protein shisa-5-like isoform X2 [Hippoglossus hippoglossus]
MSSGFAFSILGVIFGSIFAFVLFLVLIICCVCPCCLIYKSCRRRPNQIVTTTTHVVNIPVQPHPPHPSYPGYQPVPGLHGYGGMPGPTAPPHSYMEAVQFPPGPPMNFLPPPGQFYPPPPPYSEDMAHPPYNPSYGPKA